MQTNLGDAAVRTGLSRLIDYAGLFPPAQLQMLDALREYALARSEAHAWMLGRFIVPATKIESLLEELPHAEQEPVALSVIVDAGNDPRTWLSNVQRLMARIAEFRGGEQRISIEALEVPLAPLATERETYDAGIGQYAAAARQAGVEDLPAYLEFPRDRHWDRALTGGIFALARHRLHAKVRCGGPSAENVPSPGELAAFLAAAASEDVVFKATAGLHHPVRHFNESAGFVMHGFLNLLFAAARAKSGSNVAQIARVLECEDASAFRFDRAEMEEARAFFISYGSCSFREPVEDLQALGLL
jgi:hypothetical protein